MYFAYVIALLSTAYISGTGCTTPSAPPSADNAKQVDKFATEMIKNDKIREVYVKCLLDKGPCSEDAADVKKLVPEAVERGCAKCSEMHKKIIEKMMLHLKEKQPEILKEVANKFDPKGEFMKTFLSKLQPAAAKPTPQSGQKAGVSPQPTGSQPATEQSTQPAQTQQSKPIKN